MQSKKIPKCYVGLVERGLSVRFHGFWMGETIRDRAIAEWLKVYGGEGVKDLIWQDIEKGGNCGQDKG